jgi:hypothetical protein
MLAGYLTCSPGDQKDFYVFDDDLLRSAEGDEASSKLNEGLKSCKAVLASYRAMLGDDPGDGVSPPSNLNTTPAKEVATESGRSDNEIG